MNYVPTAAILVALVASACSTGTVSPSPLASGRPVATVSPPATPTTSPSTSPPSVLEGVWTTAEVTCDQLLATMHEAGFTDAQITAGNAACSQDDPPVHWRLRFLGDSFAQFGSLGDGSFEKGSGRSFRLIDDRTLFLTEGQQTLSFTLVGDVLTFLSISGSTGDLDGQVHGAAIFLTAPFTKEP